MTTDTAPAPSGRRAAGVHWDLSPLVSDAAEARARLDAALERSRAFESRYRGALPDMDGSALAGALEELAGIDNELSRVSSYAHLRESVDVTDEENKDLSAAVYRGLVEAGNALRFFDLEWIALDDEPRAPCTTRPRWRATATTWSALRRFAPHTRSEPEERMLAERGPAAAGAWHTLFGQITSTLGCPFDRRGRRRGAARSTGSSRTCANPSRDLRIARATRRCSRRSSRNADARARLRHPRRRPARAGRVRGYSHPRTPRTSQRAPGGPWR